MVEEPGSNGLAERPRRVPIETVLAAGRRAWPDVQIPEAALREQLAHWAATSDVAHAASPDLDELYLAIGCGVDAPGAMRAFETRYFESAAGALRTHRLSADQRDEVVQRTRVRLFVTSPPAKVAPVVRYAGQGRLGGLVRVTFVREALRLLGTDRQTPGELHEVVSDELPDKDLARRQHGALLKAATAAAARRLDARARTLLRLHYARGVSGTSIAQMYKVHRATASRWLTSARQRLLDEVCVELGSRAPEFAAAQGDALRELVHSQLDLSLSRIFAQG